MALKCDLTSGIVTWPALLFLLRLALDILRLFCFHVILTSFILCDAIIGIDKEYTESNRLPLVLQHFHCINSVHPE